MSYRLLIVEDTPALLQAISVFFARKAPDSGRSWPHLMVTMHLITC